MGSVHTRGAVCGTHTGQCVAHREGGCDNGSELGDTGASAPAELPLAAVSLTNGVWFGGRALMKAVEAAAVGRGVAA